jgi:predicted dehydrogenase
VVIGTRHATHAPLALAALGAGKAVFVEKPPALTRDDLVALEASVARTGLPFVVGFNRRHAPLAEAMRDHVSGRGPIEVMFRVNAGPLPADQWLNDLDDGGGRLLGEGCHFVDFACWMAGALPERVSCLVGPTPGEPLAAAQRFTVAMEFADGSLGTVVYGAGGAARLGKEFVEVHAGGRSAVLDDFRSLILVDGRRRKTEGSRRRDKGHERQFERLRRLIAGSYQPEEPGPLATMHVTVAALQSAETGCIVRPEELTGTRNR